RRKVRDPTRAPAFRSYRGECAEAASFGVSALFAITACRPFEHPREMIIFALHVAFLERQRTGQISVCGFCIETDELFQPLPGVLRQFRRRFHTASGLED